MDEAVGTLIPEAGAVMGSAQALLAGIVQTQRMRALIDATETLLLAAAYDLGVERIGESATSGDPDRDLPLRSLAAEIGAATRTSDRGVGIRMADAAMVRDLFPRALTALADGEISTRHLRTIVDAGARIDDAPARAAYEAEAVDVARRESPGRTRATVTRLAEEHAPRTLSERHAQARTCRHVKVQDADDGMSLLTALLPSMVAHAAMDRLTTMALTVREAGRVAQDDGRLVLDEHGDRVRDRRSLDELRADVLSDVLLTGHASTLASESSPTVAESVRPHVQVVIPAATLLGADRPGELAGGVAIDAETARFLAGAASGWDRLFTDPATGTVTAIDRYRPSEAQRRILMARDEHCRFPGCRMPVRRCDIDHTIAAQHDGPTEIGNLAHLCRRHHTLKHHSAWRVRHLPDGTLRWVSPTGRTHDDRPARTVRFTTADPPPF